MLHDMQGSDVQSNVQMIELTEDELTTVAGNGGFGFGFAPFVTAFTNQCATTFAASTSVAASHVNKTSAFTLFG